MRLTSFYSEISINELKIEIPRLKSYLKAAKIDLNDAKDCVCLDFLSFIAEWGFVESLPNLTLSLKRLLTLYVSVAYCEPSFWKLKLIKNFLPPTLGQVRLHVLAILLIESEVAKLADFDDSIN